MFRSCSDLPLSQEGTPLIAMDHPPPPNKGHFFIPTDYHLLIREETLFLFTDHQFSDNFSSPVLGAFHFIQAKQSAT